VKAVMPVWVLMQEVAGIVSEFASKAKAVLLIGWDKLVTFLAPVVAVIGTIIGFIGKAISGFVSWIASVVNLSTIFSVIGAVIGTAFGLAFVVIKAVIQNIVSTISGLVSIVRGVIDIIAGVFTGDWGRVWSGFKKVAHGAITIVIGWLGALVEAFAGVVDKIAGLFGKETNFAATVAAFKAKIDATVSGTLLEPAPTPGPPIVSQPPPPSDALATNASMAAAGPQASGMENMSSAIQSLANKPPPKIEQKLDVKLNIDGRELNSTLDDVRSSEGNMSYQ
jgi:hypothetical protein